MYSEYTTRFTHSKQFMCILYNLYCIVLNLKVNAKILAWLLREAFNISLNIVIIYCIVHIDYIYITDS